MFSWSTIRSYTLFVYGLFWSGMNAPCVLQRTHLLTCCLIDWCSSAGSRGSTCGGTFEELFEIDKL